MYEYYFHIIDRQFNDEYDFIARFTDHDEAARFIRENERDGNTIVCLAPYYKFIKV